MQFLLTYPVSAADSGLTFQEISKKMTAVKGLLRKEVTKRVNAHDFSLVRVDSAKDVLEKELDFLAGFLLKKRAKREIFTHGDRWG